MQLQEMLWQLFSPSYLVGLLFSKVFASLGTALGLTATYAIIVAGANDTNNQKYCPANLEYHFVLY